MTFIPNPFFGVPGTPIEIDPVTGMSDVTGQELDADQAYEFVATEDLYWTFGTNGATATTFDKLLMSGVPRVYKTPSTNRYVAAVRVSVNGKLSMFKIEN